jgi:hypothetical protein
MFAHDAGPPDDKQLILYCMKEAYNAMCERFSQAKLSPTVPTCAMLKRVAHLIAFLEWKDTQVVLLEREGTDLTGTRKAGENSEAEALLPAPCRSHE